MAKSGAEDAVASWDDGETDALLLATARSADGTLRQLVCLRGKVLRSGGVRVTEGGFEHLEITGEDEQITVRYEGEGALKLVVPWPVKGFKSGPEGAQVRKGEQRAVLVLPGPGAYEMTQ